MYQVMNFISFFFIEQRIINDICGSRNKDRIFKLNKSYSDPWKLFFKRKKFLESIYVINVEISLLICVVIFLIRTPIILIITSISLMDGSKGKLSKLSPDKGHNFLFPKRPIEKWVSKC